MNTFTGHLREPPGHWRAVCTAATEAECWRLLLRVAAAGKSVEREVTSGDRKPGKRRKPR